MGGGGRWWVVMEGVDTGVGGGGGAGHGVGGGGEAGHGVGGGGESGHGVGGGGEASYGACQRKSPSRPRRQPSLMGGAAAQQKTEGTTIRQRS